MSYKQMKNTWSGSNLTSSSSQRSVFEMTGDTQMSNCVRDRMDRRNTYLLNFPGVGDSGFSNQQVVNSRQPRSG